MVKKIFLALAILLLLLILGSQLVILFQGKSFIDHPEENPSMPKVPRLR